MKKIIAILPGDGIGPEIMNEAIKVLDVIADKFKHTWIYKHGFIGGSAWDDFGNHFPDETKEICENSDAILFGSVGGPASQIMEPRWKGSEINAVLGIRKHFNFNINLRPSKVYPSLAEQCVLRSDIVRKGIDILTVRELSSGIYFGEHKTVEENGQKVAYDTMTYDEKTIESITHTAFKFAMARGKKVSSIDKANVLDCSKLWREVVDRVAVEYPKVTLEHVFVDNCVMQLLQRPWEFDVILTSNMFGDIISDETSVFAGSLGMLPSASINSNGFAMYEPSGGSAPDIAGRNIANPIAQILSAAMMLKYSFNLHEEHNAILQAIDTVLKKGGRTVDIVAGANETLSTPQMGDMICEYI